jgi:hypothetical protein
LPFGHGKHFLGDAWGVKNQIFGGWQLGNITNEKPFTGLHDSFEVLRTLLLDAVEHGTVRTEDDFFRELLR